MAEATAKPLLVLLGRHATAYRERLAESLSASWRIIALSGGEPRATIGQALAGADALVANVYDSSLPEAPGLRLLQVPAAGFDRIDFAFLPERCVVANAYEHDNGIAEYVMAGILHFRVGLTRQDAELRKRDWRSSHVVEGPVRDELGGMTLGLVGVGHIGQAVAARAKAFDMRTIGTARSRRDPPAGVDALVTFEELLAESDAIVVACPLNDGTRGLIDERAFSRMKPDAVVVNVGRGPVIDEKALYEALAARRIGGAVIDVWYRYPTEDEPFATPSAYPFETLDNVVMTPHSSGWTRQMIERRWRFVAANLDAFARGATLRNVVRDPSGSHLS